MQNIVDIQKLVKERLDSATFDFYYGGAADEITLKENETAYQKLKLLPKVLTGVAEANTTQNIFGESFDTPFIIAPMAFQKLCHPQGELETAQGAALAGAHMIVSTYTTMPLQEIAAVLPRKPWFQLYILKERALTKEIVQTVESLGYSALVLTVDAPIYGKRERELKNPLCMDISIPDIEHIIKKTFPELQLNSAKQLSAFLDPTISWDDLAWLKSITKLPIILKGILREDDAKIAMSNGVSGIIVSNHGGRQLDTTPATISVLPRIAEVVDQEIELFIDGGIRRGSDVFKALALGAKAVVIGRPVIWGLANEGRMGVYKVFNTLLEEFKSTMILCGCSKTADITCDFIA